MPEHDDQGARDGLPEPVVPPDAYDEKYYRHGCVGSDIWSGSGGAEFWPGYAHALQRAGLRAGEVVVDVGCGRGELVALAAEHGSSRVIGIEYAPDAVALAKQTLKLHGVTESAEIVLADARAIPLEDGCADLATMLDVVEHLAPTELDRSLAEIFRVLTPGGRILIHTMPNRRIYEVTYRLQRALRPRRRHTWPANPRGDLERLMHVNEQTPRSLRRALRRAAFTGVSARLGEWVYTDFVPEEKAKRLYHQLAARRWLAPVALADMWASGRKPITPP